MSVESFCGKSLAGSQSCNIKVYGSRNRDYPQRIYVDPFLRNVQKMLGLDVHETRVEEEVAASVLMNKVKLDFDSSKCLELIIFRRLSCH